MLEDPLELLLSGRGSQLAALGEKSSGPVEVAELGAAIAAGRAALRGDPTKENAGAYLAAQQAVAGLVAEHLGMVDVIARRWIMQGFDAEAVLSAARLGLVQVAWRWDHERSPFPRYAQVTLNWMIGRNLRADVGSVDIPVAVAWKARRLAAQIEDLRQELGRQPTRREIASRTDMSVEQVEELLAVRVMTRELSVPSAEDDGEDGIGEEFHGKYLSDADGGVSQAVLSEARAVVTAVIATFPVADAEVLTDLFGVDSGRVSHAYVVAGRLGCSRQRVQYLRDEFMARLQHPQYQLQRKSRKL